MHLLQSCIDWLVDWTEDLSLFADEMDLVEWMEAEGCEALELFLSTAFRKSTTRQEVLPILRGVLWEWYLSQRDQVLSALPSSEDAVPRLLALPQTPQKTAAWYAEARDLLTGHEFAGVVYGTPNAFQTAVAKKCAPPLVVEDPTSLTESRIVYRAPLSAFQWGWRFEPVIRTLYEEEVADGRVCDTLGRIRHPTLPRLAASPDGLILEGEKAGRLLEIKAPMTRVLTGIIPQEYYCQMQLQAEVADVPAVEYIEVRFDMRNAEDFEAYGELSEQDRSELRTAFLTPTNSPVSPHKPERMGAILILSPHSEASPETWTYAYSPIYSLSEEGFTECMNWTPSEKTDTTVIIERSLWRIIDWWTTTVPRNRRWWAEVGQPAYETFWEAVEEARRTGKHKLSTSTCLIVDSDKSDVETEGSENPRTSNICLIHSDSE